MSTPCEGREALLRPGLAAWQAVEAVTQGRPRTAGPGPPPPPPPPPPPQGRLHLATATPPAAPRPRPQGPQLHLCFYPLPLHCCILDD